MTSLFFSRAIFTQKLLTFLVLMSWKVIVVCSNISNPLHDIILDLVSHPLKGRDIFLSYNSQADREVHLSSIFQDLSKSSTSSYLIANEMDFQKETRYPEGILRSGATVYIMLIEKHSFEFLNYLSNSTSWNPTYLVLIAIGADNSLRNVIDHQVVQRSTHISFFEPDARNRQMKFNIYSSYPFRKNKKVALVGVWNRNKPGSLTFAQLFPDRHSSFEGSVLDLASWCDDFPLVYLKEDDPDTCIGWNIDLIDIMGEKFNFTYTVEKMSADENWGSFENGLWTGMLGDLAYNGRHLTINYFLVNYERWKNFDCTYPYHAEGFGFMVRKPLPIPQWRNILYPFTLWIWLAIISCTVIVATMFSIFAKVTGPMKRDLITNMIMVGAGVLRQSVIVQRKRAWQRVWLGSWWAGCIIISTAYTGNLIAFLTVPAYPSRVESVEELAASDLRLTMQDYGEFVPEALKKSGDKNFYTIGHKMDLFPVDDSHYEKGVEGVMDRSHALLETYSFLMNIQASYKVLKETYLMKEQIYSGHLAWFLPRNTPYTTKISSLLMRLKEVGIVKKLFDFHFRSVTSTAPDVKETTVTKGLSIGHVQGAFLLAAVCYIVTFFVFLMELLSGKKIHWLFSFG